MKIKTLTPVQYSKQDIVIWKKKREDKQCFIMDIYVGLGVNVNKNFNQKRVPELKSFYGKLIFEIIFTTTGATGLVTNDLKLMLKRISIEKINYVTLKCKKKSYLVR